MSENVLDDPESCGSVVHTPAVEGPAVCGREALMAKQARDQDVPRLEALAGLPAS